jgi:mono/diheme cytochrome c family protein
MPEPRSRRGTTGGALLAAALGSLLGASPITTQAQAGQIYQQIARGRYLVVVADCAACHTADPAHPFAGGRPIETPFGSVTTPNITPDPDTGIGNWSDEQFDAALRRGLLPNGKRLYPAMPYTYYTRMSRSDVIAMRAYLNTIRPVQHEVHSDTLPFPFSIRAMMDLWDAVYFSPGVFQPDPKQSAEWNRGAYLALGPGHCGSCHTPKTLLGGDKNHDYLQGYNLQGWFAPSITNDAAVGLGRWTVDDVVEYLKNGHNRYSAASGPMGEEVQDSSSQWSLADLRATALYLKSQGGQGEGATPGEAQAATTPAKTALPGQGGALAPNDARMVAGAAIYSDLCSACHAPDGTGVPYLIPSLAASPNVVQHDPTTLIRVVVQGVRSVATAQEPTDAMMPSYGWQLTDEEIASVTTFIRNSWGHAVPAVSPGKVRSERDSLRPGASD